MEKKLALNFSPLKKQNFRFDVYRKLKKTGEKKESFSFVVSDRALPENNKANAKFLRYWVSLTPQKDFEEFSVDSFVNPYLTTEYLYYGLKQRCNEILTTNDFFPDESFIVNRIKFAINNLREGKQIVWVEPYYLKETKKLGFLIDFKFDKDKKQTFNRKVQQLSLSLDSDNRWNKSFYADRYSLIRTFAQKFYKKVFKGTNLDFSTNELLPVSYLEKKCYLLANNREVFSQYKLKDYGVYETIKEETTIYFYYKQEESNIIREFYGQLEDLLKNTYQLNVKFKSYKAKGINNKDISNLISQIESSDNEKSLVIFLLKHKDQDSDDYYKCKYEFTKHKIPTQFLTYATVKNKFSIQNLALQIFSKLGGIPWRVKPKNQDCLIIGLGQANNIEKKGGRNVITKYFAYSVLLDSSGIYKSLKVVSEADNKSTYLDSLGKNLIDIFKEYGNNYEKIVIHTPFKVKRDELKKIKETITKLTSHDFDFVVIRINTKNKYFAYNKDLNSLTPRESSLVRISPNEYLIWFEGLQNQDETPQKRYAGPTYIEFLFWSKKDWSVEERKKFFSNEKLSDEERSRFYLSKIEKENFLQDVINLSGANWRGFNAKSLPVSIYYCRIVSDFIKEFRQRNYARFDFSNLQPWFL
ncbi:MAG: hypothetical protein KIS76_05615 [Pyrinomonadaceae bacterium]|nr:hypothetical protein [Pyrinomonadaceae bacterium]